mmetsp:Transcript_32933/g.61254  ORF Transcript_32933/g.61254 Transcript_32933/m.61254 type:complete len:184 (-) Transcript_32933:600-1151(-)
MLQTRERKASPGRKEESICAKPFGVEGRSDEWKNASLSWPISFEVDVNVKGSGSGSEQTHEHRIVFKVPPKSAPIRQPCYAKRRTCLRVETRTQEGAVRVKFIPLKITSRVRGLKTRGKVVSKIRYHYSDENSIVVGGEKTKFQMLSGKDVGGGTPQAFLIAGKSECFSICTKMPLLSVMYVL